MIEGSRTTGTPVFVVSNIHGEVVCLGADFHVFARFSLSPPRTAKSISLSANAERLRYASLFGPFHGCLPATLFVCRMTSRVAKAEG